MQQSDDPDKLEIAIVQLEQECMRRVLDKVARGEAVFDGKLDIRGVQRRDERPTDPWKPYRRDEFGREVYRGPAPTTDEDGHPEAVIRSVITGVPARG